MKYSRPNASKMGHRDEITRVVTCHLCDMDVWTHPYMRFLARKLSRVEGPLNYKVDLEHKGSI